MPYTVILPMKALGNSFMEVVKDNIGFFYLITSQIITWQFSMQLEPVVIIYCHHLTVNYTAEDTVKHQHILIFSVGPKYPTLK